MEKETAVVTEDMLLSTLQCIWREVTGAYDVIAAMPEPTTLFEDAALDRPNDAAETVLINMVLEVIECVDRFSPWYSQPAQTFDLTTVLDKTTQHVHWGLTEAGVKQWRSQINTLSAVIAKDTSLIEAMIFVDNLLTAVTSDAPILAQCHCLAYRYIHVQRSILNKTEIICDICHQPFFPTDDFPGYEFQT